MTPALPPLAYVQALRDLGATFVRLGDAHIEFAPPPLSSLAPNVVGATLSAALKDRASLYGASLVDPIDAEADIADAELSDEDKEKKAREEFDRTLFASAD